MQSAKGFTLIELAIVLVIIGLIVGGILVGRDLISSAAVRAQITQVDKYQQAVNTFKGKYGYLPADIKNPDAPNFGFLLRYGSIGNGDGVIEPAFEATITWVDLSTARLIDGGFSKATPEFGLGNLTGVAELTGNAANPSISAYLPESKLGGDNHVYIFSHNSVNHFGVGRLTTLIWGGITGFTGEGPTAAQAYAMDTKVDDGMPTTGNVKAWYPSYIATRWDGIGGTDGDADNDLTPYLIGPSSSSCFDNDASLTGGAPHYSLTVNNGMNARCALSFKFQ